MKTWLLLLFCVLLVGASARANDGSITWGDAPRLTSSHPWVEMKSEVVRLDVGKDATKVTCDFVFVNHGPACTVRMGFPDYSEEEYRTYSQMSDFRSWVDGREVPTRSVPGPGAEGYRVNWRVKTVSFGKRNTQRAIRRVRDTYTVAANGDEISAAHYTLHTGSSWRGPIGRSEIIVAFLNRRGKLRAIPMAYEGADYTRVGKEMERTGAIAYRGPGRPIVRGQTLRWIRTKWRPTPNDDVQIFFRAL